MNGAVERVVEPGIAVVEQWETSRDFFVILDGTADVQVDGQQVAELGPGEFFGELAALDWGAGFGYSRLASVVARTPMGSSPQISPTSRPALSAPWTHAPTSSSSGSAATAWRKTATASS